MVYNGKVIHFYSLSLEEKEAVHISDLNRVQNAKSKRATET